MSTTAKMTTMPAKPETPTSRHNKQATMMVRTGAVHNTFKHKLIISKRLTSFDRRLTTLPEAVSPSAVCDNRNTYKQCTKERELKKTMIHTTFQHKKALESIVLSPFYK